MRRVIRLCARFAAVIHGMRIPNKAATPALNQDPPRARRRLAGYGYGL
ncbi:hypothetical protein ACFYT3_03020 [Nocardia amikacinitolerans]